MTNDPKNDGRCITQAEVRMPFANLITAVPVGRKGKAKGTPKFSATLLLVPGSADLKALQAKAAAVAKARWPGRDFKELKFPFTSGEKRAEKSKAAGKNGDFFKGHVVLDARSAFQPELVVRQPDGTIKKLEGNQINVEGKAKFYNGCWVAVQVNFNAYEGQAEEGVGNPDGVNAYLDAVIWLRDGDRIGGGSAVETFKAFAGTVTAENPTAAATDEIPV